MLIDLHVRSAFSGPGGMEPEAILARARAVGLGAIAFTERAPLAQRDEARLAEAGRRHGVAVFFGAEVLTERGRLLCYPAELDGFWGRRAWLGAGAGARAEEVVAAFAQSGGAVVAALPEPDPGLAEDEADPRLGALLRLRGLAGIEVLSARQPSPLVPEALRLAEIFRLAPVGGSDLFAGLEVLGRAATLARTTLRRQRDLVDLLRHGDVWPVVLEPA